MKRTIIITSLLTACLMGASAQISTPLDSLISKLHTIDGTFPGSGNRQANHGHGTTTSAIYMVNLSTSCHCGEDKDSAGIKMHDEADRRIRKISERQLALIRQTLDSISAQPGVEESYHFESHNQGLDTVRYSILLHSGEDKSRWYDKNYGYHYSEMPGTEAIMFNYTTRSWPCGRHFSGLGILQYIKTEALPGKSDVFFDWEQYLQTILPTLNQRGITQRKFRWVHDEMNHENEIYGTKILREDGSYITTGETSGTLYFIPRDQKALADTLLMAIQAATLNYIGAHPEQLYSYADGVRFYVAHPLSKTLIPLLSTVTSLDSDYRHHIVYIGSDIHGYHILLCDIKGAEGIPEEWPILKSIVKGKKTYHKGMKP